tara:strand:- start:8 stop:598 length:591 start_codon:yes stop_codon:yes gene_type:complete
MASEIRVNKINNRVGLGTVTYTDTGIIVSGISTATNFKTGSSNLHSTGLTVGDSFLHSTGINLGTGVTFSNNGNATFSGIITATQFKGDGSQLSGIDASALKFGAATKVQATNTGAVVTGILTATSFSGDGSSLSNLPAGAPVGGASTNTVFFENDKAVAVNYQVTSTKNAMSAGPIAINAGIAVTVPSGCSWTIV